MRYIPTFYLDVCNGVSIAASQCCRRAMQQAKHMRTDKPSIRCPFKPIRRQDRQGSYNTQPG